MLRWRTFALAAVALAVVGAAWGAPIKITDIKAASGKAYDIGIVDVGVKYYIDRGYSFGSLPDIPKEILKTQTLKGAQFIMTANDDKQSQGADFLTFTSDQPVRLWVCRDSRGDSIKGGTAPKWLTDNFDRTEIQVPSNGDGNMGFFILYKGKEDHRARKVTLGGNADPPAVGQASNYLALVTPGEGLSVQPKAKLATVWASLKLSR